MGVIDVDSEIRTTLDYDSEVIDEISLESEVITTLDVDSEIADELNLESEVFNDGSI